MVGLPSVAEGLQVAGITALTYDPRSTGRSDGEPRNDIDPFKQIDDMSDALSFLANHPAVDRQQLGVWGMSLAGATGLCTACFDTRVKFAIAICPATEYSYDERKLRSVLNKTTQDLESQIKGNTPLYVPMLNGSGENPAGFQIGMDKEYAMRILNARDDSVSTRTELAPNHVNRTTIQSYRKLLMWHPSPMWEKHLHIPVLYVVPELDQLVPVDAQKRFFHTIPSPFKKLHVELRRGHLDVLEGENAPQLIQLQVGFIRDALSQRS